MLFKANRESPVLRDLSRIYWRIKLEKLVNYLVLEMHPKTIILFGSLAKLESKADSDIDICIISKIKKKLNLLKFENINNRKIQLFDYLSIEKINKELKNNILNGYVLYGEI